MFSAASSAVFARSRRARAFERAVAPRRLLVPVPSRRAPSHLLFVLLRLRAACHKEAKKRGARSPATRGACQKGRHEWCLPSGTRADCRPFRALSGAGSRALPALPRRALPRRARSRRCVWRRLALCLLVYPSTEALNVHARPAPLLFARTLRPTLLPLASLSRSALALPLPPSLRSLNAAVRTISLWCLIRPSRVIAMRPRNADGPPHTKPKKHVPR